MGDAAESGIVEKVVVGEVAQKFHIERDGARIAVRSNHDFAVASDKPVALEGPAQVVVYCLDDHVRKNVAETYNGCRARYGSLYAHTVKLHSTARGKSSASDGTSQDGKVVHLLSDAFIERGCYPRIHAIKRDGRG